MFKLLLYLMIGYVVFRIVQVVMRMSATRRQHQDIDPLANAPPGRPMQEFKDVEDADFEDLGQKDKKE